MNSQTLRVLIVRFGIPALLLATCWAWVTGGTKAIPTFVANLGARTGLSPEASARVLIGLSLASAATCFLLGGRGFVQGKFSKLVTISYSFACVASIASIMALPVAPGQQGAGLAPLIGPIIGLAIAGGAFLALDRLPARQAESARRLGGIWSGFAAGAIWIAAVGIAARVPIESNLTGATGTLSGNSVVLDYVHWQGRTLPDTGLSRLLPTITALTLEGKSIVVLYNPECSHCRELFESRFASPIPDTKVIAIEIPPPPGSVALTGDGLGEMPCAQCTRLTLPKGNHYVIKPPTVVVVQDGRVVCATDSDFSACLGSLAPGGDPAQPGQ